MKVFDDEFLKNLCALLCRLIGILQMLCNVLLLMFLIDLSLFLKQRNCNVLSHTGRQLFGNHQYVLCVLEDVAPVMESIKPCELQTHAPSYPWNWKIFG